MQTQEDDDVDFSWASLITPVGPEDFEHAYSGKKPLHLSARELPDCGLGTIDGWRSMLRGQSSRLQGRGVVVDLDPAIDGDLPLAADLETLLQQGGPLIVNAVNRVNPVVEGIANALAAGLGGAAVANGYISPHRKDTLDLHADDHEVVVIQLHGVKRWTIGTKITKGLAHSSLFAINNAAVSAHARENDIFHSLELHPGDMLYLPRGLAHHATARDEISIHLSFGIFRPTGLDFAEQVLRRLIAETGSREYFANLHFDEDEVKNRTYMDDMAGRLGILARSEDLRRDFLDLCRKNARLIADEK